MSSNYPPANPLALDRGGAIKMFAVSARPSGQVMLIICVAVFALMGMIAVVADFSFLQHQRNMMQTAADSAANGYNIVVADMISLSGSSTIGSNYWSLTGGSPIRGTVLAE